MFIVQPDKQVEYFAGLSCSY